MKLSLALGAIGVARPAKIKIVISPGTFVATGKPAPWQKAIITLELIAIRCGKAKMPCAIPFPDRDLEAITRESLTGKLGTITFRLADKITVATVPAIKVITRTSVAIRHVIEPGMRDTPGIGVITLIAPVRMRVFADLAGCPAALRFSVETIPERLRPGYLARFITFIRGKISVLVTISPVIGIRDNQADVAIL